MTPHVAPANTNRVAQAKLMVKPDYDEPTLVAGGARLTGPAEEICTVELAEEFQL